MSGNFSEKIPSFVWILVIVAAVALFIGAILGGFYVLTHIEGVGSIILLVCGWAVFRFGNNAPEIKSSSIGIAVVISFFAMMGMALDQTGNYVYNKPLEWIFCPPETELTREAITRGARGGGVTVNQNFTCAAENGGEVLRKISSWEVIIFRFFQYVLLGYILLGLSRLYTGLKSALGIGRKASGGKKKVRNV
jgi:hypothetical protein